MRRLGLASVLEVATEAGMLSAKNRINRSSRCKGHRRGAANRPHGNLWQSRDVAPSVALQLIANASAASCDAVINHSPSRRNLSRIAAVFVVNLAPWVRTVGGGCASRDAITCAPYFRCCRCSHTPGHVRIRRYGAAPAGKATL